jgi:hypothetical protein
MFLAAALLAVDVTAGMAGPPLAPVGWNRSSSFRDGVPMGNYAPAYLAGGLFGVRIPPCGIARPGSCANCASSSWHFHPPTVSTLVGGYVYTEDAKGGNSQDPDGQHNLQTGASPATFPFETDISVTTPSGAKARFQASVQGPDMNGDSSVVTPLSQWLDFATGELTTTMTFGAKDGSWSVALTAVQWISQSVPSLAMQTLTVTARKPATLQVSLAAAITAVNLPGTVEKYAAGNIFGEGTPNMVLAMQSNSGAKMAMAAATQCSTGPEPLKPKPGGVMPPLVAAPCNSTTGVSTLTSFIGVVGDASHPVPAAGALRTAHFGVYRGYLKLQAENRKTWAGRWQQRIVPSGPGVRPQDQTAIDASMFFLLSSAHTASRSGLSIDAYSCLEYGGRMFWDGEARTALERIFLLRSSLAFLPAAACA